MTHEVIQFYYVRQCHLVPLYVRIVFLRRYSFLIIADITAPSIPSVLLHAFSTLEVSDGKWSFGFLCLSQMVDVALPHKKAAWLSSCFIVATGFQGIVTFEVMQARLAC